MERSAVVVIDMQRDFILVGDFGSILGDDVGKAAKEVEWLGYTRSSRHVCTDLSLMWDVRTREKPILLRQLVGDIEVYTT